jgi:hypothetical protein
MAMSDVEKRPAMSEKLTLTAYLDQRGKKAKALKRGEAEAFGIPYPLQSGWPAKYGALEITEEMTARAAAGILACKASIARTDAPWL